MKRILLSICTTSLLYAINIDVDFVKDQIKNNKNDISNRILLAKYYYQNRSYKDSLKYIKDILKLDPKNKIANSLDKKVKFMNSLSNMFGKSSLDASEYLTRIYQNGDYKIFTIAFERAKEVGIRLDSDIYQKALKAYDRIGDNKKSQSLLKDPRVRGSKVAKKLTKKYDFLKVKNEFNLNKSFKDLKDYIYLLGKNGNKKEQLKVLGAYLKAHPNSLEARFLYAEHLWWNQKLKKAFATIYPIRKESAKTKELYANILYDKGDFAHAIYYLPQVAKAQSDPKRRYYYQKRLAYAYEKVGRNQKAKILFAKLEKIDPKDKEIVKYLSTKDREDLLKKAVFFHKKKDFENALNYYLKYYKKTQDPKIAKEIGEIYYFSHREKMATTYFEQYLKTYPNDDLIRFHLASVFDKEKSFSKSVVEYKRILGHKSKDLYSLTQYRYANALMHTFKDEDWYRARDILKSLEEYLSTKSDPKDIALLQNVKKLYKIAQGEVRKPKRYKDIVLTETGKKDINLNDAFSYENIAFDKTPKYNSLLHLQHDPSLHKPSIWFGTYYATNGNLELITPKIGMDNIVTYNDIGLGFSIEHNRFKDKNHKDKKKNKYEANSLFLNLKATHWEISLGMDHFKDFDTFTPMIYAQKSIGSHDLSFEAFRRNGVFVNYSSCMVQNRLDVTHIGLGDKWTLWNLRSLDIGLDLNYFEDHNRNIYANMNYPIFEVYGLGLEHKLQFEENLEFNSKTKSCAKPLKKYDASYLKYLLVRKFLKGKIGASLGGGYSFWGKERVYSYGLNADIALSKDSYFGLSCEQRESSFSADDLVTCNFNINYHW